jgi:hypothetical protein
MTTDSAALDRPADDDGRMFCYRHPDRETWVRCGRCDQPICTKCAMQGPVGFRCKECGKLKHDPMTSFTPTQLLLGGLMAIAGGAVVAFIGEQLGFFTIIIGFFGGGLIADIVMRFTGYKRGPVMVTLLLGGIALGTLLGVAGEFWLTNQQIAQAMADAAAATGADPADVRLTFLDWLQVSGAWLLISAGAAMAGAWGRLRF